MNTSYKLIKNFIKKKGLNSYFKVSFLADQNPL